MKNKSNILYYIILLLGGSFMVFPFLWMVATSLKTGVDIFNISLIPHPMKLASYKTVLENTEFIRWFGNSLFVAIITTISVLFFDTLVGYTFAKLEFKGKKIIFIIILSTLMVPTEMLIIPWYLGITKLQLFNSYISLIFPGLSSAFGIFLMKQFLKQFQTTCLKLEE